MFSSGTTNDHGNEYRYGDNVPLRSMTSHTICLKLLIPSGNTATYNLRFIMGQFDNPAPPGNQIWGWYISTFNDGDAGDDVTLRFFHHDGVGGGSDIQDLAFQIPYDVTHSIVWRWEGIGTDISKVSVLGHPEDIVTNFDEVLGYKPGDLVLLGNAQVEGNPDLGLGCQLGHVMIYPNYVYTDAEVQQYHAGVIVPAPANLGFWSPMITEAGSGEDDLIHGYTGAEIGTITVIGDSVDSMFAGQGLLLPHRQLAGYSIRVLSLAPETYKLSVPQEYAALALGSEALIADGNLPAASSLLASLSEHFMLDDWRAMNAVILEGDIQPDGSLPLVVYNRMPSMCLFYQTLALDKGQLVNNEEEGTASLVPWAAQTNSRNSTHFIEDATEETSRPRLASVGRFSAKTNHRGTLYEVGVKNLVQNSAFLDDGAGPPTFLDTTEVLGTGGTIVEETGANVPMLFTDKTIEGKPVRAAKLTKGSSGTVSLEWSLAIDGSGDDSRVAFWHRGEGGGAWWLIRTSDGNYWQTGSTWTAGAQLHTILGSDDEWVREISAVIGGVPSTGTLRHIVGNSTGLENDRLFLAQSMFYQHWAILSDIVTQGGATETSEADDEVWNLDNGGAHDAQTFNPNRGTVRARIRFETDTDDIPNSYFGLIAEFGVDSSNYDQCFIGRSAGGDLQIWIQRYIASSLDGNSLKSIADYSRGDEVELAFRWTDATGEELGLPARTLSAFEDGTKGTDAQSAGIHSTADQTTFLKWGNNPILASRSPATFFYIKNVELVQWAIPDEGILARRVAA